MSFSVTPASTPLKQICTPQIGAALTTAFMLFAVCPNGMGFPIENQRDNIRTVSTYINQSIQSPPSVYNGTTINITGSFVMHYSDTIKRLKSFLELGENWNGYGSCTFSHQLVQQAIEMVQSLPVKPEVYPISDGSIQFEFEKTDGSYLEFEIGSGRNVNVFSISASGSEQEYQINFDTKEFVRTINDFYG